MSSRHEFCFSKVAIAVMLVIWAGGISLSSAADREIPPATASMVGVPADEPGGAAIRLALVSAEYEVDVLGSMVLGTLVQEFRNDGREDLLANYSLRGAVGLEIKGLLVEADGALPGDATAETGSVTTGDLEPTRGQGTGTDSPSVSRGKISIAPGQTVTVRTRFEMTLPLDEGRFRLVLPAVATVTDQKEEKKTSQTAPGLVPLDVPDAEGDTEPPPGTVPVSFSVNVHHDQPLLEVESESHEIWSGYDGDRTLIRLEEANSLSGRAFDLSFSIGSESEATFVAYARPEREGSHDIVAMLAPPTKPWANIIRPKQVLFILDTSGSMVGRTFDQARDALAACLEKMEPDDLYNVVEFDNDFTVLSPNPRKISSMPPHEARGWLDDLQADGGTNLLPGLSATLQQPESEDHHRMIVIFSDGGLADEEKVLELLEDELGTGRLFVVGIGKNVNREAINRIAEKSRGTAAFAPDLDSLEPVVAQLFDSVAAPLVWNLEIDFGDARIEQIRPKKLPDLYAARTVMSVARIGGQLPEELLLRGVTTDGERTWRASVRTFEGNNLWDSPVSEEPDTRERTLIPNPQ